MLFLAIQLGSSVLTAKICYLVLLNVYSLKCIEKKMLTLVTQTCDCEMITVSLYHKRYWELSLCPHIGKEEFSVCMRLAHNCVSASRKGGTKPRTHSHVGSAVESQSRVWEIILNYSQRRWALFMSGFFGCSVLSPS